MGSVEKVDVVIPVYNGAAYLGEAIDSVLAQTHGAVEVCVVDDGSTDESGAVAMSYGSALTYVRQKRAGNGAARNRGTGFSDGAVISFLDADDRWLPEKLAREVGALLADPGLDGVRARMREFVSLEVAADVRASIRAPLDGIPALHSYSTMRRDAFERIGGFTTEVQLGVGLDFSARWEDAGLRSRVLDEVLTERRLHASNHWTRESGRVADLARTIKATLDRRRAAQSAESALSDEPEGD